MIRDTIIKLAREAGFTEGDISLFPDLIVHFAALVAAAERARHSGGGKISIPTNTMEQAFETYYRRGYAAGVNGEREACDQVCESLVDRAEAEKARQRVGYARTANDEESELRAMKHELTVSTYNTGIRKCAAAIRARSNP